MTRNIDRAFAVSLAMLDAPGGWAGALASYASVMATP